MNEPADPKVTANTVATTAGRRYRCSECGAEVICTRSGAGTLVCHGQEMQS
jgi:desulfoferrodoxin-like iron-binding protein